MNQLNNNNNLIYEKDQLSKTDQKQFKRANSRIEVNNEQTSAEIFDLISTY